jgi:hypothetical protein
MIVIVHKAILSPGVHFSACPVENCHGLSGLAMIAKGGLKISTEYFHI